MLSGCGGGGGSGGGTTTVPSLTSPSELTVNVDPSCTMVPQNGYVTVAPASASSTACAAGIAHPGSNQIPVSIVYGSGAGVCPVNTALIVSANTSCGVLTNNYIPGQSSTVTLAPNISNALQQFVKTWTVSYQCHCGDYGSCTMPIDASGQIVNGSCNDHEFGTFPVTGAVDANGNFSGSGNNNGDVFSGTLSGAGTGSGTWFLPSSSDSGPWTATGAP